MLTTKEVKKKIGCSTVSRRGDVYTARQGYFFHMGRTTQTLIDKITKEFPDAIILESWDKFLPFRGGAPVAKQSHWGVSFKLGE